MITFPHQVPLLGFCWNRTGAKRYLDALGAFAQKKSDGRGEGEHDISSPCSPQLGLPLSFIVCLPDSVEHVHDVDFCHDTL